MNYLLDNQEECIQFLNSFQSSDNQEENIHVALHDKIGTIDDDVENGWNETMLESAYKAAIESHGCKWSRCLLCYSEVEVVVKCSDCRTTFCPECDQKNHLRNPFCHRHVYFKDNGRRTKSRSLLPTEFINSLQGSIEKKGCIHFFKKNLFNSIPTFSLYSRSCSVILGRPLSGMPEDRSVWR